MVLYFKKLDFFVQIQNLQGRAYFSEFYCFSKTNSFEVLLQEPHQR